MQSEHIYFKTEDVIHSDLWRMFPVINVDRVSDIPRDYPGAMGVPITYMSNHNDELFEILGLARPSIGEKTLYRRIIIRNLKPDLPEFIDLAEWLKRTGSEYFCEIEAT